MNDVEAVALRSLFPDASELVVVELGAHTGEDVAFFHSLAPVVRHIMVEPDKRNIERIVSMLAASLPAHCKLIKGAVDSRSGTSTFYPSSQGAVHGSGSLLVPTGHLNYFHEIKFAEGEEVHCYSLDELFLGEGLDRIDLLYVDIQGAESRMIEGGQVALAHTRYLFMEAEEVEMYGGQILRGELLAMLPEWELVGTFEYNVLLRNKQFHD